MVGYLLDHGADIGIPTKKGATPLSVASENGHFGVIKCLVEHGALVNSTNNNGVRFV